MKLIFIFSVALGSLILSGCAHKASVSTVSATNIFTNTDKKIPIDVSYVIDSSSTSRLKRDDAIQGFLCSAHKFPVEATEPFLASVPSMIEQIFESGKQVTTLSANTGLNLLIRIERFEPRVRFSSGFFSSTADATADLAVSVVGTAGGERIFGTTVDSQRSKTGDGGGFCEGGGLVLADATSAVIKDVLEKLGERIANSPAIRNAGGVENATTAPTSNRSETRVSAQEAQAKCAELGLKRGTEDYARCVVRLAK